MTATFAVLDERPAKPEPAAPHRVTPSPRKMPCLYPPFTSGGTGMQDAIPSRL